MRRKRWSWLDLVDDEDDEEEGDKEMVGSDFMFYVIFLIDFWVNYYFN